MTRSIRSWLSLLTMTAGLAVLSGCGTEGPMDVQRPGPELFGRYVALGNSITAGYQSAGINDSTQREAYPYLVAVQAGAGERFGLPLLAHPGCPPPLLGPFTAARVGGAAADGCEGRVLPQPPVLQNLAVPGARIRSISEPAVAANPLTLLILGGRSQQRAMILARPTLVSVWIGNNDALHAALTGNVQAHLTPLDIFEAALDRIVDAIADSTDARDAILFGVVDPVVAAPALQPGAFFFLAQEQLGKAALASCAPGTPGGANIVSTAALQDPGVQAIDCTAGSPYVLGPQERAAIRSRVASFNVAVRSRAETRGWIYIDPETELFAPHLGDPDRIRKCQGLAGASTPAQLQQAVLDSCPSPAPPYFGTMISFDGVHPSGAGHRVVANAVIARLNQKHALALPPLP
jgi:hypothetical protein